MGTGKTSTRPKPSPTPNPSSNGTFLRAQSCKGSFMFKVPSSVRPALRILAIGVSAGLLSYLVWHAGPAHLWQHLIKLGWGFTIVIALSAISHLAQTWAWHITLVTDQHRI